ncbi:hypothetical protein DPMN_059860 [Dreissena polymorpha]|uniref:Jacalin-type lectin domain-containing protein n=1 Tax=Dreissena polymorpha TaxID=45954 RepID=A0A9D4C4P3_DREPO|nr:hypothetical protein DPMN_059860 [Dreissena polymorpha]
MSYWRSYPDVSMKYFTHNIAVGGYGGNDFKFIKLGEGDELKGIKAWKKPNAIRGVEVWMTDGTNFCAGRRKGKSHEFSFERGERITQLKVQASTHKGGTRCGAIMFQTNRNRQWEMSSS